MTSAHCTHPSLSFMPRRGCAHARLPGDGNPGEGRTAFKDDGKFPVKKTHHRSVHPCHFCGRTDSRPTGVMYCAH
jgi:hypothetical protein